MVVIDMTEKFTFSELLVDIGVPVNVPITIGWNNTILIKD